MSTKQELLSKFVILCVLPAVLVVIWVFKDGIPKPKNVATTTVDNVLIPTTLYNELFVFDEPMRKPMLKAIAQMSLAEEIDKKMLPPEPAQEVPGVPRN